MREIVHIQAGQCGNQIGAKVSFIILTVRMSCLEIWLRSPVQTLSSSDSLMNRMRTCV